eukprot:m.59711 g.59711  ORF g.59711 m.59711 type:complete len:508 (+) comp6974_c0_seq1:53-1576(+)
MAAALALVFTIVCSTAGASASKNSLLFKSMLAGMAGSPSAERAALSAARSKTPMDCTLAIRMGNMCAQQADALCAWEAYRDALIHCDKGALPPVLSAVGSLLQHAAVTWSEAPADLGLLLPGDRSAHRVLWSTPVRTGALPLVREALVEKDQIAIKARDILHRFLCEITATSQADVICSVLPDQVLLTVSVANPTAPPFPLETSGVAALVVAIDPIVLVLGDPRPAARMAHGQPWATDGATVELALGPGEYAVLPTSVRAYVAPNLNGANEYVLVTAALPHDMLVGPIAHGMAILESSCESPPAATPAWHWPTHVAELQLDAPVSPALVEAILAAERSEPGRQRSNKGGWQSRTDWLTRVVPGNDALRRQAYAAVLRYLTLSGRQREPVHIDIHASWACVNRRGAANSEHVHPDSSVSGAIYLHVNSSSAISFGDPRPHAGLARARHAIRPVDGTVVVFPSWLDHGVTAHDNDDPRIVVAFNARITPCADCPSGAVRLPRLHAWPAA